jgi:hypothetical protein
MSARHAEWARFCLRHRQMEVEVSELDDAQVELPKIDELTEVRIAAKFSRGKQMSCTLFFAPLGEIDSSVDTTYYSRAYEDFREGHCLLIPLSEDAVWAPSMWPATIAELNSFVSDCADSPRYFEAWVMERSSESNQLSMVILIQGNICHGYLLGSPKNAGFAGVRVVPVFFEQVGELTCQSPVRVGIELEARYLDALLRHARQFQPISGDTYEDRLLREALHEFANALESSETFCVSKKASS